MNAQGDNARPRRGIFCKEGAPLFLCANGTREALLIDFLLLTWKPGPQPVVLSFTGLTDGLSQGAT
jgi:hypothetical protein